VRPKVFAGLITAGLVAYLLLMARQALTFVRTGEPVAVALGAAILVLPLLGAYLVVQEWKFGRAVAELGRELGARGELPPDDLPKRPSGRPERAAADARFAERAAEAEQAPQDPASWFRLAVAYDDAGDRRRARAAMRRALELRRGTGA
jgi:hypothetical protein